MQVSKQECQKLWIPERTLANLKEHLTSFQESGSDSKKAEEIYNKWYLHGGKTTMLYLNLSGH